MGFKQAAVLAPVSFFLGVLFICFNVDYRLLWTELTDETVNDGFQFYATFFSSPPAIKALLHGMVGVGIIGLISKLHRWDESAQFFDGSSLAVYIFAIAVYLTVTIPALRTVSQPLPEEAGNTRVEAIRVLSAGNILMMVALVGILLMQVWIRDGRWTKLRRRYQAGQEYAIRKEGQIQAQTKAKEEAKKKEQ